MFDDETDRGERLCGAYAAGPVLGDALGLDLYFLGLRRDDSEYDQGTHNERRRTIGTRVWGAPGAWDYNFEVADALEVPLCDHHLARAGRHLDVRVERADPRPARAHAALAAAPSHPVAMVAPAA